MNWIYGRKERRFNSADSKWNDCNFTAATTAEVSERKNKDEDDRAPVLETTAVAVLNKTGSQQDGCGILASDLPWGRGWGWSTLPNGVWIGGKLENATCIMYVALVVGRI